MTEPVIKRIQENRIKLVKVSPNMIHLFQPLDPTVNGAAKAFLKSEFAEWYSSCTAAQLDNDKAIENVDLKLILSVLKPLQAK